MVITVFMLLLSSCVSINLQSPVVTPTSTSEAIVVEPTTVPITSGEVQGLTEEILRNSEFLSPILGKHVKLVNGEFDGTIDGIELHATLYPDIQFGDLNSDGIDDTALLISENTGGTGTFLSLIVIFSTADHYQQAPGITIDDRPVIESVSISDGRVLVEGFIHGPNDAMVSPTQGITQEYSLVGENLFLTRLNSALTSGGERSIVINAPVQGEQVSGSVQVSGSMPVAPFENNLLLRILDANKNELLVSWFMVQAEDIGQSATFDNTITLPAIASGSTIILILEEPSMADGSLLTSNSVILNVK